MGLRLGPRCGQVLQEMRLTDHEVAIARHLLEPDLGRILPPSSATCDALRLLRERSLGEQLQLTHGTADTRPQTRSPVVVLIKSSCSGIASRAVDRLRACSTVACWGALGHARPAPRARR